MTKANNIVWHNGYITKDDRNKLNRHKSGVLWFTGLSAAGKSTIAMNLENWLYQQGVRTYVLDGDNVRHGLNSDLDFSRNSRIENIRRIAEVSKLFVDAGLITMVAFITPFREQREFARKKLEGVNFSEVYVKCAIGECIRRDPKGSYKKAIKGEIQNYTGISSPYEEPENPDLVIDTGTLTLEESVNLLKEHLYKIDLLIPAYENL